jgi:uncharacterized YccA/Bax inhibitor family protein
MQSRNPVFNKVFEKVERQQGAGGAYNQPGYAMPQGAGQPGYPQQGYAPPQYGYQPQYGQQGSPQDLDAMYNRPAASATEMGRMTLDDVVMKTGAMFAVLLATAVAGWLFWPLAFVGMIGGLILGLVVSFKQSTNKGLILGYAAFEGLLVGGISALYAGFGGRNLIGQAVLGTLAAFASMLFVYKMGWVKASPKFTKWLLIAGVGYAVISLASLVAGLFGMNGGWGFRDGSVGIALCVAGVAIASFFLILDFDYIEKGIAHGLPQRYSWLAAFGLVMTLVWIYLEFLRLLAILQSDN